MMELRSSSKLKTADTNEQAVLASGTTETSNSFILPTNDTIRTAAKNAENRIILNNNQFQSFGVNSSSGKESSQHSNLCDFQLVTTVLETEVAVNKIINSCEEERSVLVVDCEGVNLSAEGELTLIQVAFHSEGKVQCVIFDVKLICGEYEKQEKFEALRSLLESNVEKVIHDVHMDAAALKHQFNCDIRNVLDTQLVFELFTGTMLGSLSAFLDWSDLPPHPNKKK